MNIPVSPRVTLTAVFELFRYVDVLADIAEEHHQTPFLPALQQIRQQLESPARESNLSHIEKQALNCARGLAEQLNSQLGVARARCEQRTAELNRLLAGGSLTADAQRQRNRVQEAVEQASWKLTLAEDAVAEVEWCRAGLVAATAAIRADQLPQGAEFPTRIAGDRKAFSEWQETLSPMIKLFAERFPTEGKSLLRAFERLRSPLATVTFGGRFKSGKSSLLNAALQRSLLPTYDLPWTGANCYLMSGQQDVAELVTRTETKLIPCQTDVLQKAISLQGGRTGSERTADVHRLNLRLARFPGGSNVQWVDPPGMFDRPEMTERAWEAAHQADVIVWVFRSQQFLGESEAEAIAQFISRRGTGSVLFVENAWLEKEQADPWKYHLEEITAVDRSKLHYLATALGYQSDQLPALYVVSAEKVLQQGHGFGAATLRRLLWKLNGPDAPLIRRARLKWARLELQRAAEVTRARWQVVQAENAARQTKLAALEERQRAERRGFESLVEDAVTAFVSDFETKTVAAGRTTANTIVNSVERDGRYERELNQEIKSEALRLAIGLIKKLRVACQMKQQNTPPQFERDAVWELVKPEPVGVLVANNAAGAGGAIGGALAGAAASAWLGPGALIGAVVGGIVGAASSGASAIAKDCTDTKANLEAAAASAAQTMRWNKSKFVQEILSWCEPTVALPKLPAPNRSTEAQLLQLQAQLAFAANACTGWLQTRST